LFDQQVQQFSKQQKTGHWITANNQNNVAQAGCLFIPGPGLGPFAWQRRQGLQNAYSICGITHTTASEGAMDSLGELLIAPTQPWDALICTSHSVKAMVESLLSGYQDYLASRFGAAQIPTPVQLPVIPLGVDAETFQLTAAKKAAAQQLKAKLGIPIESIVFLFAGRLSFHAKAHPYPMLVALEQAAQQTGKDLTLVFSGWFANEAIAQEFKKAAQLICPSVQVLFVDGRKAVIRELIWHVADVFTSLADNIQETFGLTPIEAKAAGLPVVVSDWDGYRETVIHGQDGFLIPTLMPPAGCGQDLAFHFESQIDNYDHYIGKVSQTTAVDIAACTQAYITLIENPTLRQSMGECGQADVYQRFHWPVILQAYQALWQELVTIRTTHIELAPVKENQSPNPLQEDPYRLFQHYPSHVLSPHTIISVADRTKIRFINQLSMNQLARDILCASSEIETILNRIQAQGSLDIATLQASLPTMQSSTLYRTLGWFLKFGLIAPSNVD
jgi:glycosyltransferase involved in cell wall biosynthesis